MQVLEDQMDKLTMKGQIDLYRSIGMMECRSLDDCHYPLEVYYLRYAP